jgi:putative addiction module component (TIGR02574 family)
MSIGSIQAAALTLPAAERAKLIDVLWDSLSSPKAKSRQAAWAKESERRIDAFVAGRLPARDAATVFFELRDVLQK